MSAWLSIAITVVAIGGLVALLVVPGLAGLSIPPIIGRLGIGTFDGINALFFFMWTSMLQLLSVNDGLRYGLKLGRTRVPRGRASDVLILMVFVLVAVVWGVTAVHGVFAARAIDPMYLARLPEGAPPNSLQHGVADVMATYFILVALVFVLVVIARLFNPVDFDEYDGRIRAILHLRMNETAPR
ncbi:hypothetical protein [Leifsonia shinshuensis]|uniref:Uncharacterized protein n=1 Tax=Leifsonia shinshuensis TaxID=150026 RepID=A0A853CTX0_9MICO|nr:hypothetical protein [Leifsonia shinshuensis]NYJ23842.1 hypothetical protein [Leifsonia shinshuensis]